MLVDTFRQKLIHLRRFFDQKLERLHTTLIDRTEITSSKAASFPAPSAVSMEDSICLEQRVSESQAVITIEIYHTRVPAYAISGNGIGLNLWRCCANTPTHKPPFENATLATMAGIQGLKKIHSMPFKHHRSSGHSQNVSETVLPMAPRPDKPCQSST